MTDAGSQTATKEEHAGHTGTDPVTASGTSLDQKWQTVTTLLQKEIGDAAYRNWIAPLGMVGLGGSVLTIAAPTRFLADWVRSHYANRIRSLWSSQFESILSVDVLVAAQEPANDSPAQPRGAESPTIEQVAESPVMAAATPASTAETVTNGLAATLDPRFTFDNFVVGKPNELAHAAARRVAESDGVPFNPLFLYGGVGLGKTHLMHSIAWAIHKRNPERKVLYLSAEKFMYQFIRALRYKDTMAFKEQFRSVDVLMIDDVQFISGKDSTQEEFFHTFNALVDQNRQIIISADKSPSDLEGLEERLRSRLGWGLVADIHPTTYELRLGILDSKREQLGRNIPREVLEFLAHRISSNVRELEGALNRIVAHAELIGRPVTLETTQDVLQDLLRANERHVTVEDIQKKTAEHFNIRISDMHSARRARNVARPRQIAMYLSKQLTRHSLPEIGRKFGGRDHTTVMHGVRKVEELMAEDRTIREDVHLLRRTLTG